MLLTESITQQSDEKSEKVGYKCDSCIFGEIGKDPNIKSEMVDANEFVDCKLKVMTSPIDPLKIPKKEEGLIQAQAMSQTRLEPELDNISCFIGEIGNDQNPKRPKAKGRTEIHQCVNCGIFFRYKSSIKRHQKKLCQSTVG